MPELPRVIELLHWPWLPGGHRGPVIPGQKCVSQILLQSGLVWLAVVTGPGKGSALGIPRRVLDAANWPRPRGLSHYAVNANAKREQNPNFCPYEETTPPESALNPFPPFPPIFL